MYAGLDHRNLSKTLHCPTVLCFKSCKSAYWENLPVVLVHQKHGISYKIDTLITPGQFKGTIQRHLTSICSCFHRLLFFWNVLTLRIFAYLDVIANEGNRHDFWGLKEGFLFKWTEKQTMSHLISILKVPVSLSEALPDCLCVCFSLSDLVSSYVMCPHTNYWRSWNIA